MERLYDKPPCGRCKALKGDNFDSNDCELCLPSAMAENEDALMIYSIVADQYIMGVNGPISVDHNAIHSAMNLYEVEDKRTCFEKVLLLARHFISRGRDD